MQGDSEMRRSKRTLLAVFVAALTLSVNVYAANSYEDDFDDGNADGWTTSGGNWSVSNTGESSYYYEQTDSSAEFFSHGGETFWADYSVEAKIKRIDTTGWGSCDLIGRRTGEDCYLVQIGPSTVQIWNVTAANSWVNLAKTNTTNALDTWYTYKLEMVGNVIKVYKDGIELMSATDPNPILSGQIGFRTYKASARFDDIFVANLGAPWPSGQATNPYPSDGKTDVPQDVVLTWTPGESAPAVNGHMVYFSEVFNDVNNGIGGVTQSATSYVPSQHLTFGTTYYWRVDEVNGPPDFTVHSGDIWSFTTEPVAYPIGGQNITATASDSFSPATGPENTVNGSGLDADDLHSDQQTDMWMTGITGPQPGWIQYEFDKVRKLHEMWVWNFNQNIELLVGFGLKDVTIEYSSNGIDWTELAGVPEFAQALGLPSYAHDTTIDFGGVSAKYVKLTVNDNWGFLTQYGLSEVRFCHLPVLAREPHPDSGATDVSVDTVLNWRAGREAARHDVYFSADEQAVVDGTAPVATTTEPGYVPLLDLASTYYWRVDEANDVETPATWQGNFWSFSTQEYLVVDDFESYNEIPVEEESSNLVYLTWIDGFENPSVNGSTMGYTTAFQPSMERSTVHDGGQSAPLFYDNTSADYSEVAANIADLQVGQDWTGHGIKALTLRFFGDPANVVQQMYIKLNGTKIAYEGNAEDTKLAEWQIWYIDLASIGVNLSNTTELAIGFERMGALGGRGMVLLDSIRLYSYDPS